MERTATWCETLSLHEASHHHTTSLSPKQLSSRPLAVRSYGVCLLKLIYRIIDIDFLPIGTLLQGHKGIHSQEEIWMSVQEKDDLARQSLVTRSSKWWMFLTKWVGNSYNNPLLQFRSQWEARILNTASRHFFLWGVSELFHWLQS